MVPTAGDDGRWLVVGLGNPGDAYAGNRHNVGAMVLDELARRTGGRFGTHKRARALVLEGRAAPPTGGGSPSAPRLVLAKPGTYMNDSGGPVAGLRAYYDVPVERIVVVHDELDLPFESMRLKLGGGDNGHNGLRSVRASLGTGDFHRLRVGVGRPPGRQDPAAFVLRDFAAAERPELGLVLDRAADAVEALLGEGLDAAQQRFNG